MSATIKYNVPPKTKKEFIIDDDDQDTVACLVCTKTFTTETALNNHARMEHIELYISGKKEEWTKYLDKPPPSKVRSRLKRSRINETEKKEADIERDGQKTEVQPFLGPFECQQPSKLTSDSICHQFFFSCCDYSCHYRDEHARRRKALRCQVCEKPLKNRDDKDSCNLCAKGFQTNEQLEAHISKAHVKQRPYECTVCGKRFTQKFGLQQHMNLHTGYRVSCSFCPKSFSQKSGLIQHLRIHTKEKPHQCVICLQSFSQAVHLKQHMRKHTKLSPFECSICQKGFKQSKHLDHHLISHDVSNLNEEQKKKYSELIELVGLNNEDIEKNEEDIEKNEVLVVGLVFDTL